MSEIAVPNNEIEMAHFQSSLASLRNEILDYVRLEKEESATDKTIADNLAAFATGKDPVKMLNRITKKIGILERGLHEPEVLGDALEGLVYLGSGPVHDGSVLMGEVLARNLDTVVAATDSTDIRVRQKAIQALVLGRLNMPLGTPDTWNIAAQKSDTIAKDLEAEEPIQAVITLSRILIDESAQITLESYFIEKTEPETRISHRVFDRVMESVANGSISQDRFIDILSVLARFSVRENSRFSFADFITKYIGTWGIGIEGEIGQIWIREGEFAGTVREGIRNILDLEKERPGATKVLHDIFGIRHFSRYPVGALIKQFDSIGDDTTPYGIVISGQRDWNGSFHDNNFKGNWDRLVKDLDGKFNVRFIEVGDGLELTNKLREMNRRYGRKQKISFVFVNAHANQKLIELDEDALIYTKDFGRKAGKLMRAYLTSDANVVLVACSTGNKDAFAQQLAKAFGLKVIASRGVATTVTIRTPKQGADFDVTYHKDKKKNGKLDQNSGRRVIYDYRPGYDLKSAQNQYNTK